jgi:hypothetical protein
MIYVCICFIAILVIMFFLFGPDIKRESEDEPEDMPTDNDAAVGCNDTMPENQA